MAKTILAPFTHARNFISAAAFAAANGFVPFGQTDDVKRAFDALQVKGFRKDNEFYQELLELGVVNSQVQVRQVMDLLEDPDCIFLYRLLFCLLYQVLAQCLVTPLSK